MKLTQLPPVALAILLQFAPLYRSIQSVFTLPSTPLSAIFRWFVATSAALGTVDAVSGASAPVVILSPTTATATNGVPFLYLITQSSTYTDIGHHFSATPLPLGLSVRTVEGNGLPAFGMISGTPTESGVFNVTLIAKFEDDHHPNEPYPVTNLFLTVLGPPSIQAAPSSVSVQQGQPLQLTVTANVAPTPTYQWRRNGTILEGQTSSNLVINPVGPSDAGSYDVILSNTYGSITSSPPAQVTVDSVTPTIVITQQPKGSTVFVGEPITLRVEVEGTQPLLFEWLKDGQSIAGPQTHSLAIPSAQTTDSAQYQVRISQPDGSGPVLSAEAKVQVLPTPVISMVHTVNGVVHLEFHSVAGAHYQMEYAPHLIHGEWIPLGEELSPTIPTHQRITDPTPAPVRFYRLRARVSGE